MTIAEAGRMRQWKRIVGGRGPSRAAALFLAGCAAPLCVMAQLDEKQVSLVIGMRAEAGDLVVARTCVFPPAAVAARR